MHDILKAKHERQVEEVAQLTKLLNEKEQMELELKTEISNQAEELTRLKEKINRLEKELESTKVELTKTRVFNERIGTLEEANDNLKDSLFKLADEYSRDLPEIFSSFDTLTSEMQQSPTSSVSTTAVKEFSSIGRLAQSSSGNFFMIAKNCIRLLRALVRDWKEKAVVKVGKVKEGEVKGRLDYRRTVDTRASPRINSHEDEVEDNSEEEIKERHIKSDTKFSVSKPKCKRNKTSLSPREQPKQTSDPNSENYASVPAFNDIAKRTKGYFASPDTFHNAV